MAFERCDWCGGPCEYGPVVGSDMGYYCSQNCYDERCGLKPDTRKPIDTSTWPPYVMVHTSALRVKRVNHEVVEWEASFCSEDAIACYRTKSGKVLIDADIEALADEAEAGYEPKPLGDGPGWFGPIPVTSEAPNHAEQVQIIEVDPAANVGMVDVTAQLDSAVDVLSDLVETLGEYAYNSKVNETLKRVAIDAGIDHTVEAYIIIERLGEALAEARSKPTGAERYLAGRMEDPEYAEAYHIAIRRIERCAAQNPGYLSKNLRDAIGSAVTLVEVDTHD